MKIQMDNPDSNSSRMGALSSNYTTPKNKIKISPMFGPVINTKEGSSLPSIYSAEEKLEKSK
jgi:hypothetical protein